MTHVYLCTTQHLVTMMNIRLRWMVVMVYGALSTAVFAQTYEYLDGSANLYKVAPGTLDYVLVTQAQSSSGIYSGGSPQTVVLKNADYRTLMRLFDRAISLKASESDKRVKLSGVVRNTTRKVEVVLNPHAP